jgi:hypothetical protein
MCNILYFLIQRKQISMNEKVCKIWLYSQKYTKTIMVWFKQSLIDLKKTNQHHL